MSSLYGAEQFTQPDVQFARYSFWTRDPDVVQPPLDVADRRAVDVSFESELFLTETTGFSKAANPSTKLPEQPIRPSGHGGIVVGGALS
jgi:hypothetical protein